MEPGQTPQTLSATPIRRRVIAAWLAANALVPVAAGLAVGIWIDSEQSVPLWIALAVFVSAGLMLGLSRRSWCGHAAVVLAALSVGAVRYDLSFRRWPADHIVRLCADGPLLVELSGTIVSTPQLRESNGTDLAWFPQTPRTRFVLQAERIMFGESEQPVSGLVSVNVGQPVLSLAAGQRVQLMGRLYRPGGPENPGSTDWSLLNRRNGILAQLVCRREQDVTALPGSQWNKAGILGWARRKACAAMLEDCYDQASPGGGLLAAMVLGQRSAIDRELDEAFVRSGTVHILSVSGAHVGMLMGVVWGFGALLGVGRRRCAWAAILLVTAYALLAESSPPITRAALMTLLACASLIFRKPIRVANCLALSAVIVLLLEPGQLFQPGCQLSYTTLIAVIYLSPCVHATGVRAYRRFCRDNDPLLHIPELAGEPSRWVVCLRAVGWSVGWSLSVCGAAWFVGSLLSACLWHQLPLWGWLSSFILTLPVWCIMVLSLIKAALSGLVPWAATVLAWPLQVVTDTTIVLVKTMARMPGAGIATPAISPAVVSAGLAWCLLWMVRRPLGMTRFPLAAGGLLVLILLAWDAAPPRADKTLTVDVLSVGNGTACVINSPNGSRLLYDVGCIPPYDIEKWTLGPLLAARRSAAVDAVVLSHANLDHYAGLAEVLDRRAAGAVIITPHFQHAAAGGAARRLLDEVHAQGVPVHPIARGDALTGTGAAHVEVLWPPAEELPRADVNDASMVLRLRHGAFTMLLCGDIEELAIRRLLANPQELKADVLLLPHHGSVVGSTQAFIQAVDPACCIRSTARSDQQRAGEIARLTAGREYFSTADDGAITLRVTPEKCEIESFLSRRRYAFLPQDHAIAR